jgi:hypothetical protein
MNNMDNQSMDLGAVKEQIPFFLTHEGLGQIRSMEYTKKPHFTNNNLETFL